MTRTVTDVPSDGRDVERARAASSSNATAWLGVPRRSTEENAPKELRESLVDDGDCSTTSIEAELERVQAARPIDLVAGQVLSRLGADLMAVSIGLAIFWAWTGKAPGIQMVFAVGYVLITLIADATHVRRERGYVEELVVAVKTGVVALLLTAVIGFFIDRPLSRVLFLSITLTMIVIRPIMVLLVNRVAGPLREPRRLLAICNDSDYQRLLAAVQEHTPADLVIRALVPLPSPGSDGRFTAESQHVGVAELCDQWIPTLIVVGNEYSNDPSLLGELAHLNEKGMVVSSFAKRFEADFGLVPIRSVDSSWFLFDLGPFHRLAYRAARRMVDLVASVVFAAVLVVLLPFVVLAIRLDSPGPIFFSQERVGQRGRVFRIHKLRTMRSDAEENGPQFAQDHDPRVTRIGAWLRRCRIDELPQAINLAMGTMSLIGPRPERPDFVARFKTAIPFYEKRHLIKPGITGWAQVHEGYTETTEETVRKLERDLFYLRNQSLGIDLRILIATMFSIVRFAGR